MASHEVDDAELGSASAHGIPGSEAGPDGVNNSVYQPIDGSQDYQKGELQFLGAMQILNSAMILALGVFLGSLQYLFYFNRHFFFFTFYTGYPVWDITAGDVFDDKSIVCRLFEGQQKITQIMQHSFEMNIASATIALVGIAFLSVNLAVNVQSLKSCQSSPSLDLCIYMGSISNGMVSLLLILTFLELCISISTSAMWCNANCCDSRQLRWDCGQMHWRDTAETLTYNSIVPPRITSNNFNGRLFKYFWYIVTSQSPELKLPPEFIYSKCMCVHMCVRFAAVRMQPAVFPRPSAAESRDVAKGVTECSHDGIAFKFHSVPEIEVLEISPQEVSSGRLSKSASSPPQHTWLTVLKKEQEFLGTSEIIRGSLGANTASSIAGGTGITMLIINLKKSSAYMYIHSCQKLYETKNCLVASFSTEIVVMMLFLTVLGFGSAVSLTVFGAGEELKGKKLRIQKAKYAHLRQTQSTELGISSHYHCPKLSRNFNVKVIFSMKITECTPFHPALISYFIKRLYPMMQHYIIDY
ncbi:hypothetical protein P7K49_021742 [Saguinus oedipus]|uniref:Membrane-spanning 4-domains subfamily A member 3 n=1 Tax=Saguinus oedipus TaxID=9490 RepID=A0ABQ9UTH7_SAGOE|nr:hypothetical protein P7K49_021742 [Saguinus oedipus]